MPYYPQPPRADLVAYAPPQVISAADRRTARALAQLERTTYLQLAQTRSSELTRTAAVEASAIVATVKAQEIDRLAREAISGQAMLRHYSDTVAQGDPMLADELRFFSDMARLGKGEIIADLVTDFCRENRR